MARVHVCMCHITGIAQVLYSMAIIELAKPGLEATTYELIITVRVQIRRTESVLHFHMGSFRH